LKEKPELLETYLPVFPHWEGAIDFMYKILDSELAYSLWGWGSALERFPHVAMGMGGVQALNFAHSFLNKVESLGLKEKARYPLILLMFADTQEELSWKQKVLMDILAETGGKILPELEEKVDGLSFKELISSWVPIMLFGNDTHFIFACGAGFAITAGYGGTCEPIWRYQYPTGDDLKRKYMKPGRLLNDAENTLYFNVFDNAPMTYTEIETHYDQAHIESVLGLTSTVEEELREEGKKYGFEHSDIALPLGTILSGVPLEDLEGLVKVLGLSTDKLMEMLPEILSNLPEEIRDRISRAMSEKGIDGVIDLVGKRAWRLGEQSSNFHIWQERIKRALDPRSVSECSNYGVGKVRKELEI
jgi:hypothetical protein